MKTKVASLLVGFSLITTLSMAQEKITVEAQNNDISNNLDLKAVSTAFGESANLEEFEKKLNDYDSQISNLDLNKDGQVDYLRVVEKNDNGVHVVEIQAVLDKDVYQDVASIIVEKDQNDKPIVQVVGDPYLYGDNYIIEPSYAYTPSIFSFFWGPNYYSWNSPYYWGYYPSYYRNHRCYDIDTYYSNVYSHINHNQRYYYTNSIRNRTALNLSNSIRRNDLAVRHPDQSFANRNINARNKRDFEFNRNGVSRQTRPSVQMNSNGSRPTRSFDSNGTRNQGYQNARPVNSNGNIRTNADNRNTNTRTYSAPASVQQNSTFNRDQNRNYQTRPTNNSNYQTRTPNTVNRQYNNTYSTPAPSVRQPVQVNAPRQQVNVQRQQQQQQVQQRQQNVSAPRPAATPRVESNSRNESNQNSRSSDSNRR